MAEARAAVAAILSADIDTVALTHSTTDGMNIGSWGHDWQPGDRAVTTNLEHVGCLRPAARHPARPVASTSRSSTSARAGTTSGCSRRSSGPSRRGPGSSPCPTSCGRPARSCRSGRSPTSLTPAAPSSSSTAPRPPARSRSTSRPSAPTRTRCRPRSGCSGPRGSARCGSPRRRTSGCGRRSAGISATTAPGLLPPYRRFHDARRYEVGTLHSPSVRRLRPELRLAGDVRRARLGPASRRVPGRPSRRRAGRPSRRPCRHAARPHGDPRHVRRSRAGPPRPSSRSSDGGRSRSPGPSPTPSGSASASASSTPRPSSTGSSPSVGEIAAHTPETMPARPTLTIIGGGVLT